jgi:hypothetical protein
VNDLVRAIADAHVCDAAFAVVEKGNVILSGFPHGNFLAHKRLL